MFSYISMRHLTLRPFLLSFTPLLYPYLSILECPSTQYRVWVRVEKQKTENLEATTTSSIQYYTLVFYSTTESESEKWKRKVKEKSEREKWKRKWKFFFSTRVHLVGTTTHLLSYLLSLLLFILLTLSILLLESTLQVTTKSWSEVRRKSFLFTKDTNTNTNTGTYYSLFTLLLHRE